MHKSTQKIAKQYANAMRTLCKSNNALWDIINDIRSIIDLLNDIPSIKKLLYMKWMPCKQKIDIWNTIVKECKLSNQYTSMMVCTMISHHGLHVLGIVLELLQQFAYDDANVVKVLVTTAYDIDNQYQASIVDEIEDIIGKGVRADFITDETILDGMIIEIGPKTLDLSLRNRLFTLENAISK